MTDNVQDNNEVAKRITDRRRLFEILAVLVTAVGKFVFMDLLEWRFPFIAVVIVGWVVYLLSRRRAVNGIFNYWGLTMDTFKTAALSALPFGAISVVACFTVGYLQHTLNMTWHMIPILAMYPIWGTVQQLLTIGLVAGNLKDLKYKKLPDLIIILVTASLFALIHLPHYWLVLGTFILALFYGHLYLKVRNIYVLGILHGWLGALFFYTIVGRDPFLEVFGAMFQ